jgi:hypothetical protein
MRFFMPSEKKAVKARKKAVKRFQGTGRNLGNSPAAAIKKE